jgi:hypothetical protein
MFVNVSCACLHTWRIDNYIGTCPRASVDVSMQHLYWLVKRLFECVHMRACVCVYADVWDYARFQLAKATRHEWACACPYRDAWARPLLETSSHTA